MSINSEIISRWVAGIAGGLILAMQGFNVSETGKANSEIESAIQEVHELHSQLMVSMDRQKEMLAIIKRLEAKP